MIKTLLSKRKMKYDGSQIKSLWAYKTFNLIGDSMVAFLGGCDIPPANIVDLEDLKAGAVIKGPFMLHFIIEHFKTDLQEAICLQRLLACLVKDELERQTGKKFRRLGDDIYDKDCKLTISIATKTPVSSKIHFGINIKKATDVGVKTKGLEDYRINPASFAKNTLKLYKNEFEEIRRANYKVRAVE